MEDIGVFIADGRHLFRVVDRWLGDSQEGPKLLLENCDTECFRWMDESATLQMMRIYPDDTDV
jgi:hypothetical protein